MSSIIDVKQFDLTLIPAETNLLIVGKRNSGKTTLMLNLLFYIGRLYLLGCAIAPTATVRMELAKHMPSSLIWPEFDIQKLTVVMSKFIENLMPNWMENVNNQKNKDRKPDILKWLLVMDDCGFSETTFRHETFKEMYMNGRQVGQGTVLNLQRLKSIPPGLRSQLDYVFFFRDLSRTVQDSIHREFFSFLEFNTFRDFFMKCTEGYNCLVLDVARTQRLRDLGKSSKSLAECIFVFSPKRIEELPSYTMFDPFVWKLDIALKRLFKKRAVVNRLGNGDNGGGRDSCANGSSFQLRIAPSTPKSPPQLTTIQEETPQSIPIPQQTRFSGYPISTFSSLKVIPSVVSNTKTVRPSKRQLANEKGNTCKLGSGLCPKKRDSNMMGFPNQ